MGRKVEGAVPIFRGCDLSPSNNVAWAEAYLRTKWHLEPSRRLATTDMGRKLGVGLPPPWGEAGSPSTTSGILIHPTVWPQYTSVTDRTDRAGQTERSHSIWRRRLSTKNSLYFMDYSCAPISTIVSGLWSVITAHNLTPEKRDNNYSPHSLTPTSCLRNNIQLITGISPCCGCL